MSASPEMEQLFETKIAQAYATGDLITFEYSLVVAQVESTTSARLSMRTATNQLIAGVRSITERELTQ